MNKNLARPAFTGASTDQSTFRTDRIVGVLVGTACGDALRGGAWRYVSRRPPRGRPVVRPSAHPHGGACAAAAVGAH